MIKFYEMSKLSIKILNLFILLVVLVFTIFAVFTSFSGKSYLPVQQKWFAYGKVVPPQDYKSNEYRDIDIDFIAPKEISNDKEFYWIQTTGDLITLTNNNFKDVSGTLSFDIDIDPCNIPRTILFGTQSESIMTKTEVGESSNIEIKFSIESNSSIFFGVSSLPERICNIDEKANRNFMAKISNVKIKI